MHELHILYVVCNAFNCLGVLNIPSPSSSDCPAFTLRNPECLSLFGVLDGHNGDYVAIKLQEILADFLYKCLMQEVASYFDNKVRPNTSLGSSSSNSSTASDVFRHLEREPSDSQVAKPKKKKLGLKRLFTFSPANSLSRIDTGESTLTTASQMGGENGGYFSIPSNYMYDPNVNVSDTQMSLLAQCLLDR